VGCDCWRLRLQRRVGTQEVFEKAAEWCESTKPMMRAHGAEARLRIDLEMQVLHVEQRLGKTETQKGSFNIGAGRTGGIGPEEFCRRGRRRNRNRATRPRHLRPGGLSDQSVQAHGQASHNEQSSYEHEPRLEECFLEGGHGFDHTPVLHKEIGYRKRLVVALENQLFRWPTSVWASDNADSRSLLH
jgi:hypothetical protein